MKRFFAAFATCLAGSSVFAGDVYSIFPENCVLGNGGEGVVVIGNGEFSLTETSYSRVSEKRRHGDGTFSAVYEVFSEGESYGTETVRLGISDDRVVIRLSDGRSFSAQRCANR